MRRDVRWNTIVQCSSTENLRKTKQALRSYCELPKQRNMELYGNACHLICRTKRKFRELHKRHRTAWKLMQLHASSWNWLQAHETDCKLMKLIASSLDCMLAHGTTCMLLEEPWVTMGKWLYHSQGTSSSLELIFNDLLHNVTDGRTHTRHCLSLGSCRSQK